MSLIVNKFQRQKYDSGLFQVGSVKHSLPLNNEKSNRLLKGLVEFNSNVTKCLEVNESNKVDYPDFVKDFAKYLGNPKEMFPVEKENVRLIDRVLGDILHPEFQDEVPPMEKRIVYGIVKTKRLWINRWKHRMVFDESIFSTFCHSAIYRMRH